MNEQSILSSIGQPPGLVRVASDELLLLGARLHDDVALGVLYDRYGAEVYALALDTLHDGDAAEAVLQDIFLRIWRGLEIYDAARGTTHDWLLGITRRRALDALAQLEPFGGVPDRMIRHDDAGLLAPPEPSSSVRDRLLSRARAESGGVRAADAPTVVIPPAELTPEIDLASEAPTLTDLPILADETAHDERAEEDEAEAPGEAPVAGAALVADEAPVVNDAPASDEAPVTEAAPAWDVTPVADGAPVEDEALIVGEASAAGDPTGTDPTPVTGALPVADVDAVAEANLIADEAPIVDEAPTSRGVPVLGEAVIDEAPKSQATAFDQEATAEAPTGQAEAVEVTATDEAMTAEVPALDPAEAPGEAMTVEMPALDPAEAADEPVTIDEATPVEEPVTIDAAPPEPRPAEVPPSEALAAALAPIPPRRTGRQQPRPAAADAAGRRRIRLATICWALALLFVLGSGLFVMAWSATGPHLSPDIAVLSRLPGGQILSLRGTGTPTASARLHTVDSGRRAEMMAEGLPPLPTGRVYEIWVAETGQPDRIAGAFYISRRGDAVTPVTLGIPIERVQSIFVTQEQAPGVSAPTSLHLLEWAP